MNFACLELHPDRKTVPVGKTICQFDGRPRHIVGFSQENGCVELHVIEVYIDIGQREEERTHRESVKNYLRREELEPRLKEIKAGGKTLQSNSSGTTRLAYHFDVSLFYDFLRNGWEVPQDIKYEDWKNLKLYSYDIESDEMPQDCGDLELVFHKNPKYFFIEKRFTLKIGETYDLSFEYDGRMVECHINNVILADIYEDIEKICSDPRTVEAYSAEQIAEMRKSAVETAEQHCPRDMRYVAIEYECSEDVDLRFEFTEKLDEELKTSGSGSSSVMFVTHDLDKEYGTHGLPLKAAVIQQPVSENTKEVLVELFYAYTKTE